jgi:hypothetical protein
MWKVSGITAEEKQRDIEILRSRFHGLRGRIPGLLHLEVGVDASRVDYACDVVLCSEFESWAALDAYARHPDHLRVRDELAGSVRNQREAEDAETTSFPGFLRFAISTQRARRRRSVLPEWSWRHAHHRRGQTPEEHTCQKARRAPGSALLRFRLEAPSLVGISSTCRSGADTLGGALRKPAAGARGRAAFMTSKFDSR